MNIRVMNYFLGKNNNFLFIFFSIITYLCSCQPHSYDSFKESIVFCSYTLKSHPIYAKQCIIEIEIENLTKDTLVWNKTIEFDDKDFNDLVSNNEEILFPKEKVIKGFSIPLTEKYYDDISKGKMINIYLLSNGKRQLIELDKIIKPCISGKTNCQKLDRTFLHRRV